MEKLTVEIKPHHLKGNTWSHNPPRRCPLQEAMVEMGHKNAYVGAFIANVDENEVHDTTVQIPTDWNQETVEQYIKEANEGSEKSIFVELTPLES